MNLYLIGHDYRYAAEQMLLTLFPDERPEYPDAPPLFGEAALLLRLSVGPRQVTAHAVLLPRPTADCRVQSSARFTAPPWASGCRAGRGACSRACAPESS